MSVWKDEAGRYHVALQRGGRRVHRICKEGATSRDAKAKEAEIERGFDAVSRRKVPIPDAIQRWLNEEVAFQKSKKGTKGFADGMVDWVEGRDLTEIVTVAEEYKRHRRGKVTNATVNQGLFVLRRVAKLSYIRWGYLDEPLHMKIESLPPNDPRDVFLSRDELAKALRSIPNRARRKATLVAAFTGLRRGEIAKLAPVNVQGDLIYLRVTKNGKPRPVPVVHHIAFALKRLPFGVSADSLTRAMSTAFPGKRFHDTRRTCGSLLIQSGVPLEVISKILGHSSIAITMRIYAHLLVDNLREGIAALGRNCTKPAQAKRLESEAVAA